MSQLRIKIHQNSTMVSAGRLTNFSIFSCGKIMKFTMFRVRPTNFEIFPRAIQEIRVFFCDQLKKTVFFPSSDEIRDYFYKRLKKICIFSHLIEKFSIYFMKPITKISKSVISRNVDSYNFRGR